MSLPSDQPRTVPAVAARSRQLSDNYDTWSRRPRSHHLACLLLLAIVPLLRWWTPLTDAAAPLGDEPAYRAAFARVASGESPYGGTGFLYPAAFAFAGARSVELFGLEPTMYSLRAANLIGLAMVVWCSMAWLAWPLVHRLALGSAFILFAPQASYSLLLGNTSLAVAGLVVASLLLVRRAPLPAGLALGTSIALKPIAPMAVACLFAARQEATRRSRWLAGGLALLVAGVLLGVMPYRLALFELLGSDRVAATISLHRVARLLGLEVNAAWISLPLALAALAITTRLELGPARFLCFATTASLAVLPLVWSHTLVLLLPLQVLALWVAVDRLRGSDTSTPPGRLPRWVEPALVLLGVASLQFSAGLGVLVDLSRLLQLAGAIPPAIAPIGLLAYLLAHTEAF